MGSQFWQHEPEEDRGVIFLPPFIRGVKRLLISALHDGIGSKTPRLKYGRQDLVGWSREVIADAEANPPPVDLGPDFYAAFWLYPKAEALATLGWYHMQLTFESRNADVWKYQMGQSAGYYIEAAKTLPDDEEYAAVYLEVALQAYLWEEKSLNDVLSLISCIEETTTQMNIIWEKSAISKRRDPPLRDAFLFRDAARASVDNGTFSLEDIVKPKKIKTKDKWASSGAQKPIYI